MLGLEGARGLDEEPREAPIVEAGGPRFEDRRELERRAQRVTALMEDANLTPLEPRDRNDLVAWLGEVGVDDEGARKVRTDAVLHPELGERHGSGLAVDAASDDPPTEASHVDNRRGEERLGDLVLTQQLRHRRVEEDEVRAEIGDEAAIERRGHDAVDGEQVTELAQPAKAAGRCLVEFAIGLALHQPGELARIHGEAPSRIGHIELGSGQDRAGQRHHQDRGPGVLREPQRRGDHGERRFGIGP